MDPITDYILSYADVRAALGLAVKELPDDTIKLPLFALQVEAYLDSIYTHLRDIYKALVAQEQEGTTPLTKTERKIVGLVKVISTYVAAYVAAPNVKAYGLKRITDGKAEGERFANAFDDLASSIGTLLYSYRNMLLDVLREYGEVIPVVPFTFAIATATLGVDPVTGE